MYLGINGISDAEVIGSGGSATVYRATQERLGRSVAVKVLNVRFNAESEIDRRRFEREQSTLGRLSDRQGFVPLYDSGFTPEDRPYLIMPFYEAGSLQDRLDRDGPMPWRDAVDVLILVGRAVQLAHDEGVLHRDIKPANILITPGALPVIGDFGIARILDSTTNLQSQITTTPGYAPPEVFTGAEPTIALDVYALGATLFALVKGSPAFVSVTGDMNVLALMRRIESDPVPDLRELAVPDEVAKVVERSMMKDPRDRQPSASQWSNELQEALAGSAEPAPPPPARPAVVVPDEVEPEPEPEPELEPEPEPEPVQEPHPAPGPEPVPAQRGTPESLASDTPSKRWSNWVTMAGSAGMLTFGLAMRWTSTTNIHGASETSDGPFDYFWTGGIAWLIVVAVGILALVRITGFLPEKVRWSLIFFVSTGLATILMAVRLTIGGRSELDRGSGMYVASIFAAVTLAGAFVNFRQRRPN